MKIPASGHLTGRAVEEWIGSSPDAPVPPRVRLRVFERHMGVCYLSGVKIKPGDKWDIEHVTPLKAGGKHCESNMAPALALYHREKTADEQSVTAKIDRTRKKHLGIWPKSKAPLRSRGFARTRDFSPDYDT